MAIPPGRCHRCLHRSSRGRPSFVLRRVFKCDGSMPVILTPDRAGTANIGRAAAAMTATAHKNRRRVDNSGDRISFCQCTGTNYTNWTPKESEATRKLYGESDFARCSLMPHRLIL
jgi:hypothetical protein